MTGDIQTILAAGIVILAVGVYIYSAFLKKKKAGCGEGCGCTGKKNPD